jgi:hypothetical protein
MDEPPANITPEETPSTPSRDAPSAIPPDGDTEFPRRGEIHYGLYRGTQGFEVGTGLLRWEIAGERYRLTLEAQTTGAVSFLYFLRSGSARPLRYAVMSEGRFGPEGFTPEEYRTWKDGVEKNCATFHWETGVLDIDGRALESLMAGSQDLLSQMFQFAYYVFPQSMAVDTRKGVETWMVTGKKYERVHFEASDIETLELPTPASLQPAQQEGMPSFQEETGNTRFAGPLEVLHLRSSSENPVEIWLARDYLMLPVQVRLQQLAEDGETYELRARDLRIEDTDIAPEPEESLPRRQ